MTNPWGFRESAGQPADPQRLKRIGDLQDMLAEILAHYGETHRNLPKYERFTDCLAALMMLLGSGCVASGNAHLIPRIWEGLTGLCDIMEAEEKNETKDPQPD